MKRRYGTQKPRADGRVQCNAGLIDPDLWQRAKKLATQRGQRFNDFVSELLTAALDQADERAA